MAMALHHVWHHGMFSRPGVVCRAQHSQTVPCGFLLFFLVPDFPENSKVWYLNEEEREVARKRLQHNGELIFETDITVTYVIGTSLNTKNISGTTLLHALTSWKFLVLVPFYAFYGFAVQNAAQFGIYLKAYGYSVTMRNVLPAVQYVIEIPSIIIYCYISDRLVRYSRGYVVLAPLIWGIFPLAVLAFWAPSDKLRVFAFMVNGTVYMTPVFFAWVAEMCGQDTTLRAFITGATTCLFYR